MRGKIEDRGARYLFDQGGQDHLVAGIHPRNRVGIFAVTPDT